MTETKKELTFRLLQRANNYEATIHLIGNSQGLGDNHCSGCSPRTGHNAMIVIATEHVGKGLGYQKRYCRPCGFNLHKQLSREEFELENKVGVLKELNQILTDSQQSKEKPPKETKAEKPVQEPPASPPKTELSKEPPRKEEQKEAPFFNPRKKYCLNGECQAEINDFNQIGYLECDNCKEKVSEKLKTGLWTRTSRGGWIKKNEAPPVDETEKLIRERQVLEKELDKVPIEPINQVKSRTPEEQKKLEEIKKKIVEEANKQVAEEIIGGGVDLFKDEQEEQETPPPPPAEERKIKKKGRARNPAIDPTGTMFVEEYQKASKKWWREQQKKLKKNGGENTERKSTDLDTPKPSPASEKLEEKQQTVSEKKNSLGTEAPLIQPLKSTNLDEVNKLKQQIKTLHALNIKENKEWQVKHREFKKNTEINYKNINKKLTESERKNRLLEKELQFVYNENNKIIIQLQAFNKKQKESSIFISKLTIKHSALIKNKKKDNGRK